MIKNCFNYTGSKDRMMNQLLESMDYSKNSFVDLFCGSGTVSLNVADKYNSILLIDSLEQQIEMLEYMANTPYNKLIEEVESYIDTYKLSKTNKEGYLQCRADYNASKTKPCMQLYALIMHSFNYFITFNSKGEYNNPFGMNRSCFNSSLRKKFKDVVEKLHEMANKRKFYNNSFLSYNYSNIKNTMFYADPPYLISDSSLTRSAKIRWTEVEEKKLLDFLRMVDKEGGSFLLSNVLVTNGKENKLVIDFANEFNKKLVNTEYTNCNYQRKNKGDTIEVLISNYDLTK